MLFRPLFRSLALPIAAGLALLGLACKGKSGSAPPPAAPSNLVILSGTVTFDRIPIVRAADGRPLGLETNSANFRTNLPARNVRLVLYEEALLTENGTTTVFYRVPSGTDVLTLRDGTFRFSVTRGVNYMLEVQSTTAVGNGASLNTVNLLADPNGMASTVPVANRLRYCFRQDLAGNKPPTDPAANHVAFSSIQADTTLNIHIGLADSWYLADPGIDITSTLPFTRIVPTYSPGSPQYARAGNLEPTPSGSKPLAILDSIASFSYSDNVDGSFFPVIPGGYLDLNYVPGRTEPGGSSIEFDRSTYPVAGPNQQNVAFNPNPSPGSVHYLGALRGGPDDPWDEGAIFTLLARANIYSQFRISSFYSGDILSAVAKPPFPIGQALPDLHPHLALMEGLPELMAALVQRNPYLGLAGTDIRDMGGLPDAKKTIFAAPLVRALGWEAALLEHGITSPGTVADWGRINISNMRPYLTVQFPTASSDTQNLYLQLRSLATAGATIGGVTPSTIFTDAAIQNLLASAPLSVPAANIPWPRPAAGPLATFVSEWGSNPNGALPDLTLTMAEAIQAGGAYPNLSRGELTTARFTTTGPRSYALGITLKNGASPLVLSGGQVELTFISLNTPNGTVIQSFLFNASTSAPQTLVLEGRPGIEGEHFVRIRMRSPNTLQPDATLTVSLVPQS